MSNTAHFYESNAGFVKSFDKGDKPLPPARKALVLTCMDARLHPEKALGLEVGRSRLGSSAQGHRSSGSQIGPARRPPCPVRLPAPLPPASASLTRPRPRPRPRPCRRRRRSATATA
jgi:hypothetical protein